MSESGIQFSGPKSECPIWRPNNTLPLKFWSHPMSWLANLIVCPVLSVFTLWPPSPLCLSKVCTPTLALAGSCYTLLNLRSWSKFSGSECASCLRLSLLPPTSLRHTHPPSTSLFLRPMGSITFTQKNRCPQIFFEYKLLMAKQQYSLSIGFRNVGILRNPVTDLLEKIRQL